MKIISFTNLLFSGFAVAVSILAVGCTQDENPTLSTPSIAAEPMITEEAVIERPGSDLVELPRSYRSNPSKLCDFRAIGQSLESQTSFQETHLAIKACREKVEGFSSGDRKRESARELKVLTHKFVQRVKTVSRQEVEALKAPRLVYKEEVTWLTTLAQILDDIHSENADNEAFQLAIKLRELAKNVEKVISEPLFPICSNNSVTRDWAQARLAGDLAASALQDLDMTLAGTKVAIGDTGFDSELHQDYFTGPISLRSFSDGDEGLDENGHGTSVYSAIAGSNGLGVAPGVDGRVFRVAKAGDGGKMISNDSSSDAVLETCKDGYKLINTSFGSIVEERGDRQDEQKREDLLRELETLGCTLFLSAGNSSYRQRQEGLDFDLDDALVRVSAISSNGYLADFSSNGEVSAPGGQVFLRHSSHDAASKGGTCEIEGAEKTQGGFFNGTSFASPFAAGVMAYIDTALGPKEEYQRMSSADQVALKNRILKSSHLGGAIRALNGLYIAQGWRTGLPTVAELKASLSDAPPKFCQKVPELTCDQQTSQERKSCVDDLRHFGLACDRPERKAAILSLISTFNTYRNLELSLEWILIFSELYPDDNKIHAQLTQLWSLFSERWRQARYRFEESDYYISSQILSLALKHRAQGDATDLIKGVLRKMMTSAELVEVLIKHEGRGGGQESIRMAHLLDGATQLLGKDFVRNLFIEDFIPSNREIKSVSVVLRLMDTIMSLPLGEDIRELALELEEGPLKAALFQPGSRFPYTYREKVDNIFILAWFGDSDSSFDFRILEGFVERQIPSSAFQSYPTSFPVEETNGFEILMALGMPQIRSTLLPADILRLIEHAVPTSLEDGSEVEYRKMATSLRISMKNWEAPVGDQLFKLALEGAPFVYNPILFGHWLSGDAVAASWLEDIQIETLVRDSLQDFLSDPDLFFRDWISDKYLGMINVRSDIFSSFNHCPVEVSKIIDGQKTQAIENRSFFELVGKVINVALLRIETTKELGGTEFSILRLIDGNEPLLRKTYPLWKDTFLKVAKLVDSKAIEATDWDLQTMDAFKEVEPEGWFAEKHDCKR